MALSTNTKSGIYMLHWGESCKYYYYGQTIDFTLRKRYHINKSQNEKHSNIKILRVAQKYGIPTFSVIETCAHDLLNEREQYYLDKHFGDKYCCNLSPTAQSPKGIKRSAETREKMRSYRTGQTQTQETKDKIRERKKHLTPQQRINLSNGQKGKIEKPESNEKRRQFMLNIGQEYRDKMRAIKIGTYTGSENHSSKVVLDTVNGIYYDSLKEVAQSSQYKYGYLKMMVSGRSKNKTNFIYA